MSLPKGTTHPQSLPRGGRPDVIYAPNSIENPSHREGLRVGITY